MNNNKINWTYAVIAGITGTLAFDIVGYIFTGTWWDIAGIIGEKTGLGMAYGVLGHYSNGILLSILYAGIAPSLWGPYWLRAQLFVTAETIALVWFFMFPLLGAGIAGTKLAAILPVVSLARHWAYALPLWYFNHQFNRKQS
ncbi:hypothetical protein CHU92_12190 [Flavobacterium cyanobacteriorum]|uniref:DUF2938 domain-containing protein n=2 Tax=Flavobacterium cyanobacteriorum TaxID=2022802 RepID=A0A255YZI4_9FLAO|nr:hypothetical protein CHU92_12190 [Flavobacterium cyanobacteriorum]